MEMSFGCLPIFIIDAFTEQAFSGNPAAVCLLGHQELPIKTMQKIASEMNLSETAFLSLINKSDSYSTSSCFGLRWFTPSQEVNLCGHATLASATAVFRCMGNVLNRLSFHILSGVVLIANREEKHVISLDFPLNNPSSISSQQIQDVADNLSKLVCGEEKVIDMQYSSSTKKLLLRLADNLKPEEFLQQLCPNFASMLQEDLGLVKGVIVTCKNSLQGTDVDFYSRYFTPWQGINEDPVTGSSHTVLAPYWASILGKNKFNAKQCSKRGGELEVECVSEDRCVLRGKAVVVLEGKLHHPFSC